MVAKQWGCYSFYHEQINIKMLQPITHSSRNSNFYLLRRTSNKYLDMRLFAGRFLRESTPHRVLTLNASEPSLACDVVLGHSINTELCLWRYACDYYEQLIHSIMWIFVKYPGPFRGINKFASTYQPKL